MLLHVSLLYTNEFGLIENKTGQGEESNLILTLLIVY